MIPLLFIEQVFFTANFLKVFEGAWVPLLHRRLHRPHHVHVGARLAPARQADAQATRPISIGWCASSRPSRRIACPVRPCSSPPIPTPRRPRLMHNLKHNRVLHERNIVLSIRTEETPRVPRHERVDRRPLNDTFISVVARYGFMETPSVPKILESLPAQGSQHRHRGDVVLPVAPHRCDRRPSRRCRVAGPAVHWLARTAEDATTYFKIPDRSRRRGRHAGRGLTTAVSARPVSRVRGVSRRRAARAQRRDPAYR